MSKNDGEFVDRVKSGLGASRVIELESLPSGGALDLMQLRAEVASRLKSSGGRPTDPELDIQRLVRFRQVRWKQLQKLAKNLSTDERKVSPAQVAGIILDQILEGMKEDLEVN